MLRAQTFIQSGIAQSQESCTSGRQASATTCRMYERAQHPPYSDHPPSYYAEGLSTASSSSLASPPSYTCGHAPDELVLLPARGRTGEPSSLRHLQASNSQNLPSEFVYTSKRVTLHLGRRVSPTRMPVFGKGATINGLLRITSLDTVESIKIIAEGVITIITMKRSIPNITTSKTFLSRILNVNLPSTVPHQQHFSFTFPSRDDTNSAYLPPTFFAASTDTEVDVRYTVKVHVRRKAFRKQEWYVFPSDV
ncbi:hypothetical protein FRC02_009460 [Tulasnella sp. 418]|nr:hypothetical protein FRC02_009460 [Tulasnella sp. 418]